VAEAKVTFGDIPVNVLEEFAKEAEPYRHSGGYELTAMSGSFIKSINGSHSAIQGLDMYEICCRIIQGGN
jgi:predicted house-cleaning NTP pyrophosphatase (Maf/HAM1 superfamily)